MLMKKIKYILVRPATRQHTIMLPDERAAREAEAVSRARGPAFFLFHIKAAEKNVVVAAVTQNKRRPYKQSNSALIDSYADPTVHIQSEKTCTLPNDSLNEMVRLIFKQSTNGAEQIFFYLYCTVQEYQRPGASENTDYKSPIGV